VRHIERGKPVILGTKRPIASTTGSPKDVTAIFGVSTFIATGDSDLFAFVDGAIVVAERGGVDFTTGTGAGRFNQSIAERGASAETGLLNAPQTAKTTPILLAIQNHFLSNLRRWGRKISAKVRTNIGICDEGKERENPKNKEPLEDPFKHLVCLPPVFGAPLCHFITGLSSKFTSFIRHRRKSALMGRKGQFGVWRGM